MKILTYTLSGLLFALAAPAADAACSASASIVNKMCAERAESIAISNCGKNTVAVKAYVAQCASQCGFEQDEYYPGYFFQVTGKFPPGYTSDVALSKPAECYGGEGVSNPDYHAPGSAYCKKNPGDVATCGSNLPRNPVCANGEAQVLCQDGRYWCGFCPN